jgi:hypothetical protein
MSSQNNEVINPGTEAPTKRRRRKAGARGIDVVSFRITPEAKARLATLRAPTETLHQTARRMALATSELAAHARVGDALNDLANSIRATNAEGRERHRDLSRLSEALGFLVKRGQERDASEQLAAQHDAELRAVLLQLAQRSAAQSEELESALRAVAEGLARIKGG